jgi:hypothetical protein
VETIEQVFEKQVVAISVLLKTTIDLVHEVRAREAARKALADELQDIKPRAEENR